ncbi:Crp/Fnr family transcriptional regulator [Halolactibacillus alkaliphilus]|uniref:Crp/Fnr family transcriptional regulator n=1 Tax=Halolactibacillus alkaliphilus TaxID=442899 RepID=A0A511X1J8_9BACI|nr:Crp/Fnr family transcriptional regulator [Halolactibacillus alkaliphilus]GEN56815.1 Crp/Fnr family transcriptional regulator [Halolactibacillus alkaliphilus]GGN71051.1 Crp/Fnr family transcriptional regulator [Halolactibacillus alkaliphilus]SFO80888.1 transcriptional regulator, Crp/Fnr family [Halolactibacillus alkaliphilus]
MGNLPIKHLNATTAKYFASPDYTLELSRDQFLFRQGDPATDLYLIKTGQVLITKTTADGRELSLRFLGPGDLIGEVLVIDSTIQYLVDAKVIEDVTLLVFRQDALKQTLKTDAEALLDLLNYTQLMYRKDQTKFRDLVLHGKKGALYSTLIRLSNSYGKQTTEGIIITKNFTNQALANFCATSRESVNRLLNDLKKQHIISYHDQHIIIHDLNYLKEAINCDQCPIVLCTIN